MKGILSGTTRELSL